VIGTQSNRVSELVIHLLLFLKLVKIFSFAIKYSSRKLKLLGKSLL